MNQPVDKLWTKDYTFILLVGFLLMTSFSMVGTVLPLYAQSIGATNSIAGVMLATFTFSSLLTRPLFGNLLTVHGNKRILIVGVFIISLGTILYFIAHTIALLIALRVVMGIGFSAFTTASGTIVSNIVPENRRGEGIGYYALSFAVTTAFAPGLGLYLTAHKGYSFLFLVGFVISFVGFAVSFLIKVEEKHIEVVPSKRKSKEIVLFEKTAIPAALVLFFFVFANGGILTFIPIYAKMRHIEGISLYYPIYTGFILLSRVSTGKIFDRKGIAPIIIPSVLLAMSGLVILAQANTLMAFLLAGALFGLGYGTIQPALNAVMISVCTPERRGLANAAYYSTMDISIGLGAVVCGLLSQWIGFTNTYMIAAALILFSFQAYSGLLKKQLAQIQKEKEPCCVSEVA